MKIIGRIVVALLAGLILFEAYAVWRAKQRTPQVLAEASTGPLKLSDLPKRRLDMLLKIEDPGFYRHHGIDFSTPGAGMTTITQGLVKRFYFEHFRPGFPKLEQSLIAWFILDPAMPKDRQIEAFLNFAYFGEWNGKSVNGFADAAKAYYKRPLNQLTNAQYLSLVAMLMAPNVLDPLSHKTANDERVRRIEAMLEGKCHPTGLRDVTYEACARVTR